jgi:type II secretory pathway component PulF
MNYDEFAFFNQQLAGMLHSGIPLEGALKQLCAAMHQGALRAELGQLEADLAKGVPLREALPRRKLPEFYARMVQIGAGGNDLPGMLSLLADYYRRRHSLWTRLKGLMVYPAMVLAAALGLSVLFISIYSALVRNAWQDLFADSGRLAPGIPALLWLPVVWLVAATVLLALALGVPSIREWLRWRLPGFKESSLCQFAASMKVLLSGGNQFPQALGLMQEMEQGSEMGAELKRWQQQLAAGRGRFNEFAGGGRFFPGLFLWLVGQSGEDLAAGFARAAELYYERARHKMDTLLYAALPVAVLVLGAMIFCQVFSMIQCLVGPLNLLGDMSSG